MGFFKKAFKSIVNVVKKVVKAVAPIALAIAIPFAAPYVAASLSLTSAFGATFGTALAGAGLGAASAALQGQNIGRGALFGGISSGLGAATGTTGIGSAGDNAIRSTFGLAPGGAGLTVPGVPTSFSSGSLLDGTATGLGSGAAGAADPFALSSTGFGASAPTATGFGNFAAGADAVGTGLNLGGASVAPSAIGTMGAANGLGVAAAPSAGSSFTLGASGGSGSFLDAVKGVPGNIASRVSDPKFLADLTLRAGSQLLGGVFAGDGLSEEEQAILNQQTEELKQLKDTNFALFQERLNNARNLIGEARYFDPEYMGLQSARQQQLAGARAKTAGLRGLNSERRESEERRFDLATARDTGTAYDQGYGTGVNARLNTITAGIGAYPSELRGTDGYAALLQSYGIEDERRAKKEGQIGSFFKGLFDPEEARRQSDPGAI